MLYLLLSVIISVCSATVCAMEPPDDSLFTAIQLLNPLDVERALTLGANPDFVHKKYGAPLVYTLEKEFFTREETAICNNRHAILTLLIKYGADVTQQSGDRTALFTAALHEDIEAMRIVCSETACTNDLPSAYKKQLNMPNVSGKTPLHVASSLLNAEGIEHLLKCGALVNAPDKEGAIPLTALLLGCLNKIEFIDHLENVITGMLYSNDPEERKKHYDKQCQEALAKTLGGAKLLVGKGANCNHYADKKMTPMHLAAYIDSPDLMALFLSHKGDPNITDENENTPLNIAVGRGLCSIVTLLLSRGADPNKLDKNDLSLLIYAGKRFDIMQALLEAKANPDGSVKSRSKYMTPIQKAAFARCFDRVPLLIAHGADIAWAYKGWRNKNNEYKDAALFVRELCRGQLYVHNQIEQCLRPQTEAGSTMPPELKQMFGLMMFPDWNPAVSGKVKEFFKANSWALKEKKKKKKWQLLKKS